jgi:leucyl/phenylalanyl-tRNA--protein transferase
MPVEPPPTDWVLPPADAADEHGLVGIGADLRPGTLLAAYRSGMFPMPLGDHSTIGWWSPDPRGVIPIGDLRVTRSLRRSIAGYRTTIDTAFAEVVAACADPAREGGWINDDVDRAYNRLHELGWAHSVETRESSTGELVGGLYGVHIGGLFAGESMFHRSRDASKVALVALVDHLRTIGVVLLDVQWLTPHLATLGAVEIARPVYLSRLAEALARPTVPFSPRGSS